MECYRVHVPNGVKVHGVTAAGVPTVVLPGEYLVHRLQAKAALDGAALMRFVGADAAGHDVHVPEASLRRHSTFCELPGELLDQNDELAIAA